MDMHTIKFGLGVAAVFATALVVLFTLYAQMGASRQKEKVMLRPKERQK